MKPILLGIGALVVFAASAHAHPHITVTGCDTVSTSPLRVKTTFTVDIPGPSGAWCGLEIFSTDATTTTLTDCGGAPDGWDCQSFDFGSPSLGISFSKPETCFNTGDHLEGFSIVANRPAPCVLIRFANVVFQDYDIVGCLLNDGPVAASTTSWGKVKALYR